MPTFGDRLKELRNSMGWTQEQLAERLGTSKQVISRYESGLRSPKISVVAQWAEALGVPLDQFADDTSRMTPEQEIVETLYRRPGMKILFDAAKDAPDDVIETTISVLEALKHGKK